MYTQTLEIYKIFFLLFFALNNFYSIIDTTHKIYTACDINSLPKKQTLIHLLKKKICCLRFVEYLLCFTLRPFVFGKCAKNSTIDELKMNQKLFHCIK